MRWVRQPGCVSAGCCQHSCSGPAPAGLPGPGPPPRCPAACALTRRLRTTHQHCRSHDRTPQRQPRRWTLGAAGRCRRRSSRKPCACRCARLREVLGSTRMGPGLRRSKAARQAAPRCRELETERGPAAPAGLAPTRVLPARAPVAALQGLRHPHIISFFGVMLQGDKGTVGAACPGRWLSPQGAAALAAGCATLQRCARQDMSTHESAPSYSHPPCPSALFASAAGAHGVCGG